MENSSWRPPKPDIHLSQRVHKITTKLCRVYLRTGVKLSNETSNNNVQDKLVETAVENTIWRPLNLKYSYLGLHTRYSLVTCFQKQYNGTSATMYHQTGRNRKWKIQDGDL